MAVADGVNVGYDVFISRTKVTEQGGHSGRVNTLSTGTVKPEKRLELQDEDEHLFCITIG